MATTYRGYDLKTESDGKITVHSMGSFPVVNERFDSEEDAMDFIDAERRKALRK